MGDNKGAQSKRSRSGSSFQNLIHTKLDDFLEDSGLDTRFELLPAKKLPLLVMIRGEEKVRTVSPDHIIRDRQTLTPVVMVGDKKSFRERWKEDDRDALLAKEVYRGLLWIE